MGVKYARTFLDIIPENDELQLFAFLQPLKSTHNGSFKFWNSTLPRQ